MIVTLITSRRALYSRSEFSRAQSQQAAQAGSRKNVPPPLKNPCARNLMTLLNNRPPRREIRYLPNFSNCARRRESRIADIADIDSIDNLDRSRRRANPKEREKEKYVKGDEVKIIPVSCGTIKGARKKGGGGGTRAGLKTRVHSCRGKSFRVVPVTSSLFLEALLSLVTRKFRHDVIEYRGTAIAFRSLVTSGATISICSVLMGESRIRTNQRDTNGVSSNFVAYRC